MIHRLYVPSIAPSTVSKFWGPSSKLTVPESGVYVQKMDIRDEKNFLGTSAPTGRDSFEGHKISIYFILYTHETRWITK